MPSGASRSRRLKVRAIFADSPRLRQVSLAVNDRDHKRVGQTVTHEWSHRRPQTRFIVINSVSLSDELNESLLLLKKAFKRSVNV